LFDRHVHVLAPAVDPTGAVAISSSHSFARNEKIARILEYDWGGWANPLTRDANLEAFNRGVHLKSVIAALEGSDRKDVAAALKKAFPDEQPRPVQSFDVANQQRLKRKGLDLPALRILVTDAWNSAADRSEFEVNLSGHGLIVRAGDKAGVVMIETFDGESVGSLARLARIKKASIQTKMEKQDVEPAPTKWDDETYEESANDACEAGAAEANLGGSGIQEHTANPRGSGTVNTAGGAIAGHAPGRSGLDADRGEPALGGNGSSDHREIGQDHRTVGGAGDRESVAGFGEGLIAAGNFTLAFGLAAHIPALTAILGQAVRNALSQDERVAVELGEAEEDARVARAMIDAPPIEPASLIAARERVSDAEKTVEAAQSVADGAREALTALQPVRPWWRRMIGLLTGGNAQHAAQMRAASLAERNAQSALSQARTDRRNEETRLASAIQRHKDAVKDHIATWTERAKVAEAGAVVTVRAREILHHLPGAATLGPAGLHRIAAKFPKQEQSHCLRPRPDGDAALSLPF
jgi:hypothetical protein